MWLPETAVDLESGHPVTPSASLAPRQAAKTRLGETEWLTCPGAAWTQPPLPRPLRWPGLYRLLLRRSCAQDLAFGDML
jgi:hypothetical protein